MRNFDLRSDTVTLPTKEMMESILQAELGDDVSGEDPTVNKLEELTARMFRREAALLTTSGTQSNLICTLVHCQPGDEMLVDSQAHIYFYEVGSISAVAGVIPRFLESKRGIFTPPQVEEAMRGNNIHFPRTSLLEIENTHNRAGGTVWSPDQVKNVAKLAKEKGLGVHMDGARIFNASVALDVPVSRYARSVDSLCFCLSKGLSAPIGSLIVGDREFIEKARKKRKLLGGGMRQAGIVAAPGIIALTKMVNRLKEDHNNARKLAKVLNASGKFKIDMKTVQTNIIVADVSPMGTTNNDYLCKLRKNGILAGSFGQNKIRLVTHYGITEEDIDEVIQRIESLR